MGIARILDHTRKHYMGRSHGNGNRAYLFFPWIYFPQTTRRISNFENSIILVSSMQFLDNKWGKTKFSHLVFLLLLLFCTENDYLTRRQKTVTMPRFQKIDQAVSIGAKSNRHKMMKIDLKIEPYIILNGMNWIGWLIYFFWINANETHYFFYL